MKGQYMTNKRSTTKPPKLSWKEKIKQAKRYERVVQLCIRGDLFQQIADKDLELATLMVKSDGRMVGNPEALRLSNEIIALQDEMREFTEPFRYRGLPPEDYQTLEKLHPPRDGDAEDAFAGHNRDDFIEALIKVCLVSPPMDDEDWAGLLPELQQRQYDELGTAAWLANKGEVSVPNSQAASRIQTLVSESKRLNAPASLPDDSVDGNPVDARLTGTAKTDDSSQP